jgi:hypothetical protein
MAEKAPSKEEQLRALREAQYHLTEAAYRLRRKEEQLRRKAEKPKPAAAPAPTEVPAAEIDFAPRQRGRPRVPVESQPWTALGISRRTWYRRKAEREK